jgi:hypothetical protein
MADSNLLVILRIGKTGILGAHLTRHRPIFLQKAVRRNAQMRANIWIAPLDWIMKEVFQNFGSTFLVSTFLVANPRGMSDPRKKCLLKQ